MADCGRQRWSWGQNREGGHSASALTAETAADLTSKGGVLARAESVGKTAKDLAVPLSAGDTFAVSEFSAVFTIRPQ